MYAGAFASASAPSSLMHDLRMLDFEDIGTFTAMAIKASESTLMDISLDLPPTGAGTTAAFAASTHCVGGRGGHDPFPAEPRHLRLIMSG